jgi:WD40 repeat protein
VKRIFFLSILGFFLVSCGFLNPSGTAAPITIELQIEITPVPTRPPYNLPPINASNVNQLQPLYIIRLQGERTEDLLAISPDKKWTAAGRKYNGPINIQRLKWNSESSFVPQGDGFTTFFLYKTTALAFSPDSMQVAIANSADNTVLVFSLVDLPNESDRIVLPIGARPQAVVFTKDSQKLIVGTWGGSGQAVLQLWDIGTASLEQEISGEPLDSICSAALSPDGKILAAGSCATFDISTWDVDNGYTPLSQLAGADAADSCPFPCPEQRNIFGFNPATGEIVSAVNFPGISIHDPRTGNISATIITQPAGAGSNGGDTINALAFTSDGAMLVMAANQEIQFIDAKNGNLVWRYADPKHTNVVAISADSTLMLSLNVDGEMVFWGVPSR